MRNTLFSATLVAALTAGVPGGPAQAAGCIKGAIAGGLAGHAVGHGVLGAAGGCVAGRTIANRSARQKQLDQQNMQTGSQGYAPNGGQAPDSYSSGASQSQGYGTNSQGRGYDPRTVQQGSNYAPGTTRN